MRIFRIVEGRVQALDEGMSDFNDLRGASLLTTLAIALLMLAAATLF